MGGRLGWVGPLGPSGLSAPSGTPRAGTQPHILLPSSRGNGCHGHGLHGRLCGLQAGPGRGAQPPPAPPQPAAPSLQCQQRVRGAHKWERKPEGAIRSPTASSPYRKMGETVTWSNPKRRGRRLLWIISERKLDFYCAGRLWVLKSIADVTQLHLVAAPGKAAGVGALGSAEGPPSHSLFSVPPCSWGEASSSDYPSILFRKFLPERAASFHIQLSNRTRHTHTKIPDLLVPKESWAPFYFGARSFLSSRKITTRLAIINQVLIWCKREKKQEKKIMVRTILKFCTICFNYLPWTTKTVLLMV